MLKLNGHWTALLVANTCSGIGTSLLYSSFESWMVKAHQQHKFPSSLLEQTFQRVTIGNGIIAIISGLVAEWLVGTFDGVSSSINLGPGTPFVLSAFLCGVCGILALVMWQENYGNKNLNSSKTFQLAWNTLSSNMSVLAILLIGSFFEATIFSFVFIW